MPKAPEGTDEPAAPEGTEETTEPAVVETPQIHGAYFFIDGVRYTFTSEDTDIQSDPNATYTSTPIQDAIEAALASNIDGKTIYIDDGIYNEDLCIGASLGGYTLKASGAVFGGNISLQGVSNFALSGLSVSGDIHISNSSGVTVEGTAGDDTLSIVFSGTVRNITIDGCAGGDSIMLSGSADQENVVVEQSAGDEVVDETTDAQDNDTADQGEIKTEKPRIFVKGGSGNDVLDISFVDGNPISGGGLMYDGGDDYDVIALTGGAFETATYTATDESSGTIDLDGTVIEYTNIEPITDNTTR